MSATKKGILDPAAHACFERIKLRLMVMGGWHKQYASGVVMAANCCAEYLSYINTYRQRENVTPSDAIIIEQVIEQARLQARGFLADYLIISYGDVRLLVLNENGVDKELAGFCAPLNKNKRL
jgi:hypothetical protein